MTARPSPRRSSPRPVFVGLVLSTLVAGGLALAKPPRLGVDVRPGLLPETLTLTEAFPGANAAGALFAAGKPAEALVALEKAKTAAGAKATTPGQDLLKGILLLSIDQPQGALDALVAARPGLPDLKDVVDVHLGQALAESGSPEQGAAILRAVPRESPFHHDAVLRSIELDLDAGATAQALVSIGAEIGERRWEELAPDELLLLGRALESGAGASTSDLTAALRAYQILDVRYPRYRQASIARTHLAAMAQDKGLHPPPPSFEDRYAGALTSLRSHQNVEAAEALTELLEAMPKDDPLACDAALNLARAYQKERRYSDSQPWLERVDAPPCSSEERVTALFLLGRAYSRKGEDKAALKTYAALLERYPEHSMADDALLLAAAVHQDNDEQAQAEALLRRQLEIYPTGDMATEAAWRLAWAAHNQGRSGEASEILSRLLAGSDSLPVDDRLQARYWIAWLDHQRADGDAARDAAAAQLQALALDAPLTYYGLLAARRLEGIAPDRFKRVREALPRPTPVASRALTPADLGARLNRACLLYSYGLRSLSQTLLSGRDWDTLSDEARWHEALVFEALGQYNRSVWAGRIITGRDHLTAPGADPRWLVLGYPLPWADLVETYASENSVDPSLLMGLMREESNFEASVRSWAGASGLTQLMWPTAKETARKLGLNLSKDDLIDPATNIRIGARFLGELLKRFDGQAGLAVPSYNAGAGAVSRWTKERGDLDFDAFVEEIPYKQTRDYVKRVLGSYQTYHFLYRGAGDEPWIDVGMTLK